MNTINDNKTNKLSINKQNFSYLENYSYIIQNMDEMDKENFLIRCKDFHQKIEIIFNNKTRKDVFYSAISSIISPNIDNDLSVYLFIQIVLKGKISYLKIKELLKEKNIEDLESFLKKLFTYFVASKNLLYLERNNSNVEPSYMHCTHIGFWILESFCKNWENYIINQVNNQPPLFIPLIEFEEESIKKILCVFLKNINKYTFTGISFNDHVQNKEDKMEEIKIMLNEMFFEDSEISELKKICEIPSIINNKSIDTKVPFVFFKILFKDNEDRMNIMKRKIWKLFDKSPAKIIDSQIFTYEEILSNREPRPDMLGDFIPRVKLYVMFSELKNKYESQNINVINDLLKSWKQRDLPVTYLVDIMNINSEKKLIDEDLAKIIRNFFNT